MKNVTSLKLLVASVFLIASCQKLSAPLVPNTPLQESAVENTTKTTVAAAVAAASVETFETGTKASYATGNVTFSTGSWTLNDALVGNTASDAKNGTQSVRVRNSGILSCLKRPACCTEQVIQFGT